MKEIKKIDNYKRIRIPVEFQNYLGWKVGDEIEVEVVSNGIILRKHESVSDFNVVSQDDTKEELLNEPIEFSNYGNEEDCYIKQAKDETKEPIIKDTLDKMNLIHNKLNKPPTIEEYFKINSKLDLNTEDELSNKSCSECGKPIGKCRFKLNHKYICKDCRNKFRDKLYFELLSKKERLS